MKKTILLLSAIALLSFTTQDEPKRLGVFLTKEQWVFILTEIDNSPMNHQSVKAINEMLIPQLNQQLQDSTKGGKK